MNNIKTIAAAVALLGCATSGVTLAQTSRFDSDNPTFRGYDSPWYIAPSINAAHPDKKFGSDHHSQGIGLRFGKVMSSAWDLQFGPTYTRQRYNGVRYQQDTFGADALFMFSRSSFRPFVLVGGGLEYDKVNIFSRSIQHDRTSPYLNAGLGFQFAFSNRWGMQADVRRAHAYLRGNDFGFDRANTNIATLGLTFAFGAPRARPMQATRMAPEPVSSSPAPTAVVPAQVAVTPAPVPPPPPRFERVTLSATELFAFDRADLSMPQPKLDEIADAMKRNPQIGRVTITGYTDRLGSAQYNMRLSQRRADTVKAYLIGRGVDASRLTSVGKGASNPLVVCTNKKRPDLIKCLEPNRRVEVEQIVIERRVS